MKVIIVEGPDNCGKDTLINKLSKDFLSVTHIHFVKPDNKQIQNTIFRGYAYSIVNNKYNTNVVILNRAHYGEYVYGCLYRGISDKDALDIIQEIDKIFIDNNIEIYYIQLLSSSPELLVDNDDDKSLSMASIEIIKHEINRFKIVYEHSLLKNKKIIYVNDGNQFRNANDIYNEVINFINS